MQIIIARIKPDKRVRRAFTETEGYRIFDTDTREATIYTRQKVIDALKSGVKIKGLKISKKEYRLSRDNGVFSLCKVPFIDGFGNYIDTPSAKDRIVYGYKGFAEAKKFYLVDHKGQTKVVPVDDFYKLVEQKEINGAKINNGKITIAEGLYNELV